MACSGVGSPGVWEKFVRSMAYIKQQKPLSVDFRGKLNGESTRRFHVTFENGGQYDAPLLRSEVGRGLARGIFLRPACHTCGYTSTDRTGDLTLCDMTGGAITPEEKRLGVSLLLINTAKGAQVFDSLPLHRRRCGLAEAVAADRALRSPTPVSVDRSRFFDALEQEHDKMLVFIEGTRCNRDKHVRAKTGAVRYRYVDGKRCYFYPIWVPGIMEMVPAIGQRNFAPPYSRMSRMGRRQPFGTPFSVGSWDRDRWVLTIMVQ